MNKDQAAFTDNQSHIFISNIVDSRSQKIEMIII